ncbi:YceI family protein [Sinomicrobium weinanense]|uniref:YceI family protein n=1 Tax=Sinomicrobium weinanense TaxID=2842200 RepID=A0A926JS82_9FLAO|nr:YceI family protein [Sinomicrobium weinanense]MBC9796513.1 YceI family protein [Sinomicrobium weinanense]MBU3123529.1 YceI family protein [Sinomicrobium weinanense]
MKNKFAKAVLALVVAFSATAFTSVEKEEKEVDVKTSKVTWKGYKVTGSHEGTVNLQKGTLTFEGDKLAGGEFVVDMASLTSTDLEGEYQGKLNGHLKSDDFFGVEAHPTSKLVFTEVKSTGKNAYEVTGDLTIKGKTHPVTFELSVYGNKATGAVKVDRTKYDIKYKSGNFFENLGDNIIYDEFDLVVDLNF